MQRSLSILILLFTTGQSRGQAPAAAKAEDSPLLRLQPGGPTSYVTGLAFAPDGRTLYEAGWDKVVRVWTEDAQSSRFILDERATLRVPIGPGLDGAINALAVSPDGVWVAVAGRGIIPGAAGFLQNGLVVPSPAKTDEMRWAEGTIFVFDTRAAAPTAVALRGHRGPVLGLAFAAARAGKPPLLVSAGHEMDRTGEVRLWDVSTGEYLAGLSGLPGPEDFKTRPALAAWHTGPGRTQVRVAVAWWAGEFAKDRGILRYWDADRAPRAVSLADGRVNDTLAFLPGGSQLLTGSFFYPEPGRRSSTPQGQLSVWNVLPGPAPRHAPGSPIGLRGAEGEKGDVHYLPRAVAGVAEGPDGRTRYAALILQKLGGPAGGPGYELRLVDLAPGSLGATRARVPLGMGSQAASAQPALAVDRGGQRLAVALGEAREVVLFSLPELLAGRAEPRQALRSAGLSMAYVGFVARGKGVGLVLSGRPAAAMGDSPREPEASDLVFDFSGRRISADQRGWVAARPAADGWSVRTLLPAANSPAQGSPRAVEVRRGGGRPRTIALPAGETVTALAFHPRPPGGVPIVAIASRVNSGEPSLRLYSAATGDWVRQFTAHSERIRSLSFSEDGRLLASTADDRTTCVWSLVDLGGTLGKRGRLLGLSVSERGGRLVVNSVDAGGPALREGDVLEGILEGGALRPLRSVVDFYNAVSLVPPGRQVTVRRAAGQAGPADVPVSVGQGTDERKPLLSLFVTPGEAPGEWRWIGWNPQGPYETSGPELEPLIGWHFNTGNSASPTRFARAPEYRNKFYHQDITRRLIERGSLPPPAPPPLPAPNMSLSFDDAAELAGSQIVVQKVPKALTLSIVDRPIPAELIGVVACAIGGLPPVELKPSADRTWSADVSRLPWAAGVYPVRVSLRTTEASPQTFSLFRELRFQRPAPGLSLAAPAPRVVNEPELVLRVEVVPSGGGPVRVTMTREPGGEVHQEVVRGRTTVTQAFRLEPGTNRFAIAAVNTDALTKYEDEETTDLSPFVVNCKQKALAPTVELTVVPAGPGPAESPLQGATIRVTVPRVALRGKIGAQEELVEAELWHGGKTTPLAGFVRDRDKAFSVDERLVLTPGSQTYVVRARAADSDPGEGRVTIDYQPQLPRVETVEVSPEKPVLYEHEDDPKVALRARLIRPEDYRPLKAVVLVDSDGQPGPKVVPAEVVEDAAPADARDEPALRLTADVPLAPGENHLRIRLTNEWGAEWTGDETVVAFRRPPRLLTLSAPEKTERGSIKVEATIDSPTDLQEAQVEVVHDGDPRRVKAEFARLDGSTWSASSDEVPLVPGTSTIRVVARNADGWSHAAGPTPRVTFTRPKPPEPPVIAPPEVRDTTSEGEITIPLTVVSAKPLTKVELRRKVSDSKWDTISPAAIEPAGKDDRGRTRFRAKVRVPLVDGLNHLEAVARSEDGEGKAEFVVSRVAAPIRFEVDGFVLDSDRKRDISPKLALPEGRVWVHGRVLWPNADVRRRNATKRVQVIVNGFPQVETPLLLPGRGARLRPATRLGPLEDAFQAGILLGREDNSLEFKIGDAAAATDGRPLSVACQKPDTRQRLHLLLVGIGPQDKAELKAQALKAVQGKLVSDRPNEVMFKTPAFASGKIYGPLPDEFTKMHVIAQVARISELIRLQNNVIGSPTGSEFVLIYYQGGEWIGEGRTALLLRRGRARKEVAGITIDELVRPFIGTRGAKLLLLDVSTPAPAAKTEPWSRDVDHVGLLRMMWLYPGESQRSDSPDEAKILSAVEELLPQVETVGQLRNRMTGRFSQLNKKYPNLKFEDNPLPEPFDNVVLGRP